MRTATDIPEAGQTVRTTTVRTILPADPLTAERKTPDFWDYFEKLPSNWGSPPDRHLLYVYRRISESGPCPPLERCAGYMAMPDKSQLLLNNREELEFAIAAKYGGGTYRLIMKNGSERVCEGRITAEGPQKNTPPGIFESNPQNSSNSSTGSTDPSSDVAKTAMNLVANHEGEGIRIGMHALQGAADVVSRFSQPASPAPSQGDDFTREFMRVMMARALNPPDPLEMVTKVLTLAQTLSGGNGGVNPIVNQILDAGLKRVLDPAPTGPVSSTGAELVRALPQVIGLAAEAAKEWRVGSEAQLQTAQVMAASGRTPPALPPGQVQPGHVQPPATRPITQATQVVQNPAPQGAQAMPAEPPIEWIEAKVVEIIANKALSAEESADEALSFIDHSNSGMFEQLMNVIKAHGEVGLMHVFQTRPVLRQATTDMLRLQEFVQAVLKLVATSESEPEAVSSTVVDKAKLN